MNENEHQKPRRLVVTKTREYLWRLYCWNQHADHNWVTCWHVEDADTGEQLAGGHDRGNNTRSGSANLPRKKDAAAWRDGYLAAQAGELDGSRRGWGGALIVKASPEVLRKYGLARDQLWLNKRYKIGDDSDLAAMFEEGARQFFLEQVRAARKSGV